MKSVGIIGGGVAGLTAGIYLRKHGIPCEIFERNQTAGGNLTGWRREGCVIDNCLHWLTGTRQGSELYELWQEVGMLDKNTDIYRAPYFYMSELEGKQAALYASPERARRELLRLSPADKCEIERFFNAVEIFRDFYCHSEKLNPKVVREALRYGCLSLSELADRFQSPLLKRLFTDYIGGNYMALGLLVSYAAFCAGNASLPAGGSPAAAERIVEKFVSMGGVLHTGCEVRRIVIGGREATGILTANGKYYPFDTLFCACDPAVTYGKLLPGVKPPRVLSEKTNYRFSALHAAFSCDSSMLPRFGTLVIDAPLSAFGQSRLVIREFSHEPAFAPKGRRVIQCMLLQSEQESQKWISLSQKPNEYLCQKEIVAGKMARALLLRFPAITESLRLLDVWTPATYRRYFGAPSGSFMPWYMPARRLPFHMPKMVRPYRNIYLVSQWEHSPGGLPGAALAGKCAGERLAELECSEVGESHALKALKKLMIRI